MVRVKYRYIAIEIKTQPSTTISQESYKRILYDLIYERYGMKAALHLYSYKMIEHLPVNNICIFRILREVSIQAIDALKKADRLGNLRVDVNVLCVSGSVRNIMKKTIKYKKMN